MTVAAPVEIQLDGAKVSLPYTLAAAKRVNSHFGNFVEAYQRVTKMDLEAYPAIIAAALGKDVREVEQHVFEAGMEMLVKPVTLYLQRLANNGRDVAPAATGTEQGNG